ncbi:MAG: YebC/PmpR family DNA-binding transcriptional regulator [Nitrospiraceae bacterium]
MDQAAPPCSWKSSDNRNRTVAEIRSLLTKNAGNMAEAGAVAWRFQKKGMLVIEKGKVEEDQLLTIALDAGAEDVKVTDKAFEVITSPHDFEAVKKAISDAKIETTLAELTFIAQNTVTLDEKAAEQMLKLRWKSWMNMTMSRRSRRSISPMR